MNQDKREHIMKSLAAGIRIDGRKADEFRPITIEVGVSTQLPRLGYGDHLPRHRTVRADIDSRQRSIRHWKHEVHDERSSHDWHLGWRQHRDP